MAEVTRKPFATASELQRHNIIRRVIMPTARFRIDLDTVHVDALNGPRHAALFCRGQINTSAAPMIQHAIIIINPLTNEPLCWLRLPKNFGPKNPPMLAVQLINPIAAAAAALVRISEGKVK